MKWVSHKALSGSIAFLLTGNPILAMATAVGSVIPDSIEGKPDMTNYNWRRKHRCRSHWYPPYVLLLISSYSYAASQGVVTIEFDTVMNLLYSNDSIPGIVSLLTAYFMLGACLHIIEDAFCGKVPGNSIRKKIGIKLFSVGSIQEYALVFPISCLLVLLRLQMDA